MGLPRHGEWDMPVFCTCRGYIKKEAGRLANLFGVLVGLEEKYCIVCQPLMDH